jgi:hypothetical protein
MRKVPGSIPGTGTDRIFVAFTQFLHSNARIPPSSRE